VAFGGAANLNAGDTLLFAVNRQGNFSNDSTGLKVNISVPEPSTIALIAMALLSMFGFGMMRRRADA
jgi:predicted transporter